MVLQYTDDALITIHASLEDTATLKDTFDRFALATSLTINFHKTTFVPINTYSTTSQNVAFTFGCDLSSFPQIYLGLPSSTF